MNPKEKYVGMFWGAVLILFGAWFLVTRSTSISIADPWLAMAFTGGLSLAFFASYFLSGLDKWGWLFPACLFAGITLTVLFANIFPFQQSGWIGTPVLFSIAVPFLVFFLRDREKNAWALIPAFGLAAITLISALADRIPGDLVGTLMLLLIALPFLAVYLRSRTCRWALIVFGVLVVISLIPALSAGASQDFVAPVVLFLFAAAFFVVFFTNKQRWWALIPAGTFTTLFVVALLTPDPMVELLGGEPLAGHITGAVFCLGLGLTFLALWLRRVTARTAWAIYPAAVLGVLAVITLITGQAVDDATLPIFFIAGGVLIIYLAYRRRYV